MKKLQFVCTGKLARALDRSKTAEEMFENVKGFEVRSAGTGARERS